jgi:hypothetical protein
MPPLSEQLAVTVVKNENGAVSQELSGTYTWDGYAAHQKQVTIVGNNAFTGRITQVAAGYRIEFGLYYGPDAMFVYCESPDLRTWTVVHPAEAVRRAAGATLPITVTSTASASARPVVAAPIPIALGAARPLACTQVVSSIVVDGNKRSMSGVLADAMGRYEAHTSHNLFWEFKRGNYSLLLGDLSAVVPNAPKANRAIFFTRRTSDTAFVKRLVCYCTEPDYGRSEVTSWTGRSRPVSIQPSGSQAKVRTWQTSPASTLQLALRAEYSCG